VSGERETRGRQEARGKRRATDLDAQLFEIDDAGGSDRVANELSHTVKKSKKSMLLNTQVPRHDTVNTMHCTNRAIS
jgi:hypothetical protein